MKTVVVSRQFQCPPLHPSCGKSRNVDLRSKDGEQRLVVGIQLESPTVDELMKYLNSKDYHQGKVNCDDWKADGYR